MLPRETSVRQLKKLRSETKGTDIGDLTTNDRLNAKVPNLQRIGNPVDSGIESWEEFSKKDSKLQTIAFKSKLVNKNVKEGAMLTAATLGSMNNSSGNGKPEKTITKYQEELELEQMQGVESNIDNYFAYGSGQSSDISTAKKMAMSNAKAKLLKEVKDIVPKIKNELITMSPNGEYIYHVVLSSPREIKENKQEIMENKIENVLKFEDFEKNSHVEDPNKKKQKKVISERGNAKPETDTPKPKIGYHGTKPQKKNEIAKNIIKEEFKEEFEDDLVHLEKELNKLDGVKSLGIRHDNYNKGVMVSFEPDQMENNIRALNDNGVVFVYGPMKRSDSLKHYGIMNYKKNVDIKKFESFGYDDFDKIDFIDFICNNSDFTRKDLENKSDDEIENIYYIIKYDDSDITDFENQDDEDDVKTFESFSVPAAKKEEKQPEYTILGEEKELKSNPNFGIGAVKAQEIKKITDFNVIDPHTPKERPIGGNAGIFIDNDIVKGYVNRIEGKDVYVESIDEPMVIKKFNLKDVVKIKK